MLSVNSFYIIDDAKQRDKMTEEFYSAVKKEIALYQEKADYLIQSGSRSPAVMERWVNKIATLEQKKQHYEEILRRELDGLDDEFETLRLLSQELSVRADNRPAISESGLTWIFDGLKNATQLGCFPGWVALGNFWCCLPCFKTLQIT